MKHARRTAGEGLQWLGSGYARHERARPDRFVVAYMGKDYGGRFHELLSMGLEGVYRGRYDLAHDADFRQFILGLLGAL